MAAKRKEAAPEVVIEATARFYRATKYHVSVRGVSYGRCKKYWDDFEELYDALEMRYSDQLQGLPFPTYCTRRNHSKKEAVEINRKNLETMLAKLLQHQQLSRSDLVIEFLQLTEFVAEEEPQHAAPSASAIDALRNRPGPRPDTVKRIYHNTALDEADEANDDESSPALDDPGRERDGTAVSGSGGRGEGRGGSRGGERARPAPSEAPDTVWIGR